MQDSGNVSGIRDLTIRGKRDSPNLGTGAGVGKKDIRVSNEFWDGAMGNSREKGAGMRDQEPPFQIQCLVINSRCSHVGCSSSNVLQLVYDLEKVNPSGRLQLLYVFSSDNYL